MDYIFNKTSQESRLFCLWSTGDQWFNLLIVHHCPAGDGGMICSLYYRDTSQPELKLISS